MRKKYGKKTNHFSNAEGWIETAKNILDPDMVTYDILHGNFHVYIQSGNGTNIIVCMTVKNTGKHEYVNAIDTAFELTDNGINRGREIILYEKEKALPQIKTEGERLPPFSRSDSAEKN